jgi:hypothetical protein
MGGRLYLAREPVSFIRTPTGLFLSLALRVRTILSASGPFCYCLHSAHGEYPIKCSDLCPPRLTFFVRADPLSVAGGPMSYARGQFSLIRTPSGIFCSLALRMWTIFIMLAWQTWTVFCQNARISARHALTFVVRADYFQSWRDLCPSHVDRLHLSGPRVDFYVHSRFACRPFNAREFPFLLLA